MNLKNFSSHIVCLTILMMGSALHAMDVKQSNQIDLDKYLINAVRDGDIQQTEELLASGANIEARDKGHNATPLMWAIVEEHEEMCDLLLDKKADVNAQCESTNPLRIAAGRGLKKTYLSLLAHGAVLDPRGKDGSTVLSEAVNHNTFFDICKSLLENGVCVNARSDNHGTTALMNAAASGHNEICTLLLAHGALIPQEDRFGWTALMRAAAKGNVDTCQFLVRAMIKFSQDQVKSLVALLGSSKLHRAQHLNLVGRDGVTLIIRDLCNQMEEANRSRAEKEILKIKDCDHDVRDSLLQYLKTL